MKWLTKPIIEPGIGDIRIVKKFAWLPTKASNQENAIYFVWLDFYYQKQIFEKVEYFDHYVMAYELKWVKFYNYINL